MRLLLYLFLLFALWSCSDSGSSGGKPTEADITAYMKKTWEKEATGLQPRSTISINNIQMGTSDESNYAQQLEGVPKESTVTHAKIDFTQHQHYDSGVRDTRRIMTAWVYKDQFGEWVCMNTGTQYPGN